MVTQAHWIPVFPFLAFLVNIFWGRRIGRVCAWISIAASCLSLIFSAIVLKGFLSGEGPYTLGEWISFPGAVLSFGVIVDPLSVMMLLLVSFIATLIKIYSVGYMQGDPRYSRYFAYISLFTAFMLGLVLADNFIFLYIFWEGVGLCSCLLIAFWFERPAAAQAGVKAFITTRIGDTAFLLGILILAFCLPSLDFSALNHLPSDKNTLLATAAILIFFGAVGKSAQFPLHVWLPDAMEGPTAVSALIHAATMVAAGVYLVARAFPLFLVNPVCLQWIAVTGGVSALMAASIACVNNDIKRILAYSTISQLGLMMLGLGAGGYAAGLFHLMTHAFFKALLFLCAGSVIHAVHTQDIREMGGLLSRMKVTGVTFIIGGLALAGVPPFSGFWSKDEILSTAFAQGHTVLLALAISTTLLTSFYMTRLIFSVLFGEPRVARSIHKSPRTMTVPLVILAVLAGLSGFLGSPLSRHAFQRFILGAGEDTFSGIPPDYLMMGLSTMVSFVGIGAGYLIHRGGHKKILSDAFRSRFTWLYQLLSRKYYLDEIYEIIFIKPTVLACRLLSRGDNHVIDGIVNAAAYGVSRFAAIMRPFQTGLVQNYLLIQLVGVIILMWAMEGLWSRF